MRLSLNPLKNLIASQPAVLALAGAAYGMVYGCTVRRREDRYVVRKGQREIHLAPRHGIYLIDAIKRFERFHRSVAAERIGAADVVDFSVPKAHRIPWLGVDIFYTSLAEEEADHEAYMRRLALKPGDVIFDIGAYCGATTYLFSKAVGEEGRVVAIEADPENHRALVSNIQRLGLRNVEVVHAAVWSSSGTLSFAAEAAMGSAVVATGPRKAKAVDVPALTFADVLARVGLDRVDHVKMDIEGAEFEVLGPNRSFFERYRPNVMLEVHKNSEGVVGFDEIARFFTDLGYGVVRDIDDLVYCDPVEDRVSVKKRLTEDRPTVGMG